MSDDPTVGGYFSRNFLPTAKPNSDSSTMRIRIAKLLTEYCGKDSLYVGRYIEQELGIACLKHGGTRLYVNWDELVGKASMPMLLDVITAVCKCMPSGLVSSASLPGLQKFSEIADRVFREEKMAYRLDELGGVHPFVDAAFSSEISELVRNLTRRDLNAAKVHLLDAEKALIATSYDGRAAVRAIFDAVENLFKLLFPAHPRINKQYIDTGLRPLVRKSIVDQTEATASESMVDSLASWVKAGHNYRHANNQTEPAQPSLNFAVQYVSQGLSYTRWLSDFYVANSQ